MSNSHNLYDVNTDNNSMSDELAPADGYFNRGESLSSAALVQDPSIDTKPEPKTLIPPPHERPMGETSITSLQLQSSSSPQQHASSSRRPRSSASYSSYIPVPSTSTPISPTRRTYSERSSLLSGPPPAYSPSTSTTPQAPQSYNTILQPDTNHIPPRREPESMGNPGEEESTRFVSEPSSRFGTAIKKKNRLLHNLVFFILLLIGGSAVVTHFFLSKSPNGNLPPIGSRPNDPVEGLPPSGPADGLPGSDPSPISGQSPYCTSAKFHQAMMTYEFRTDRGFSVFQTRYLKDRFSVTHIETVGEIRLRRIPSDTRMAGKPYVTVDIHVSDPDIEIIKHFDQEVNVLEISTPEYASLTSGVNQCVSLEITIWLPENAKFTDTVVEAVTLTLRVMDDVKMSVSDRSLFKTVSGRVILPHASGGSLGTTQTPIEGQDMKSVSTFESSIVSTFSSRRLFIETISGSISGTFPLEDLLSISSKSGTVTAAIVPAPASASHPEPAQLVIETVSGSIKAFLPVEGDGKTDYLPPLRNYLTRIHSNSGAISGLIYVGPKTYVWTTSGTINLAALPILESRTAGFTEKDMAIFQTRTVSAMTAVTILEPLYMSETISSEIGDSDPYRLIPSLKDRNLVKAGSGKTQKLLTLKSLHSTTSGSITANYPDSWEGKIHAKTISGRVMLIAKRVKFLPNRPHPGRTDFWAQRGLEEEKEGCLVELESISGSEKLIIG